MISLFGVAATTSIPVIGLGVAAAVIALDYAGKDGGLMESYWIWYYDLDVTGYRLISESAQSEDPNQKLGPGGYGDANFVAPGGFLLRRRDAGIQPRPGRGGNE